MPIHIFNSIFPKTLKSLYGITCMATSPDECIVELELYNLRHTFSYYSKLDSYVLALFISVVRLCKMLKTDPSEIRVEKCDTSCDSIKGTLLIRDAIVEYHQQYAGSCIFMTKNCDVAELNMFMAHPNFEELFFAMKPELAFYDIELSKKIIKTKFGEKYINENINYYKVDDVIKKLMLIEHIINIDNTFYCDIHSIGDVRIGKYQLSFQWYVGLIVQFKDKYVKNVLDVMISDHEFDCYRKPIKIATNIF